MNKNSPDERLVYLALKNIFRGADAQIRKAKKVRELVQKSQRNIDVRDLIQEHNLDNVCSVAKALLEQQIFESTLKAKIRFPEVFEISPAQSAERSASEAEAARLEADAVKSVAAAQNNDDPAENSRKFHLIHDEALTADLPQRNTSPHKRSSTRAILHVPSLYPVYLPYQIQHQLLVKVQSILENACYDFALREMKDIIERESWDCPECVELNVWARTLLSNQDRFREADLDRLGKSFDELANSLSRIRHTAVHRLRISANALELFLVDAENLLHILQDDHRTKCLTRLRRETQLTIGELKRNKDVLESKLKSKFQKIAEERAELDRLEQLAVEEMLREDREYQMLAGANLDEAIRSSDTAIPSAAPTEVESRSESEPEIEIDIACTTSNYQVNEHKRKVQDIED